MDLGRPGSDLIGANEAAALEILALQAHALSGREVARLAGASASSVRRALERLSRIGLVHARSASHAVLYSVNREHLLWEPVASILSSPRRLEAAIGDFVAESLPGTASVIIFGSVARRQASPGSDVDVALVTSDDVDPQVRDDVSDGLSHLVESLTGNAPQIVQLSRTDLQSMEADRDPLLDSWRKDGRVLTGPHLDALLRP